MKRLLTFGMLVLFAIALHAQDLSVDKLSCNYRTNPLGVDALNPTLGWQLVSSQKNVLQTASRILVADDAALLAKNIGNAWDSKKILSSSSTQIKYAGKVLVSAKKYFWKLQVWDNKGNVAESKVANWQMGLLKENAWMNAKWIGYENLPDSSKIVPAEHGSGKKEWGKRPDVLPLLRKSFSVSKKIKQATAFICGLGQFEMSINGKKVGDHFLDPGWTKFDKQALCVTFDITDYVSNGSNAIGVILGNGFFYIPGERYRKMTGAYGYPKMITRILIEYTDGASENIVSDESWKTAPSPITYSSIYGGENYDATLEQPGWDKPGFNDANWKNVVLTSSHKLVSQTAEPIKVMQEFEPAGVKEIKMNTWVYDMGQNMSGIPQITVTGNAGDTIRITPAELLKDDGTANQKATGSASYYQYILKGKDQEKWQPRFSYYGFRYVQVDILPNKKNETAAVQTKVTTVKALHTRNSAATVGSFNCSNELFNKINSLIKWSVNSNMQSIFTDCPHRERLGWLEQLHLMGTAIQYNYDIHTLSKKITADIGVEQNVNGLVPSTVPEYTQMHFADGYFRDSPEWGSTAILFPWSLYQWYGDKEELVNNYVVMQKYMNYLRTKDSSHLLMYGLSDWYDLGPNRPGFCQLTPMGLTATAYYYNDLVVMKKIATLLGKKNDAIKYALWADTVNLAFNKMFYHADTKQYGSGSQTSNAIAISMGLVNEKDKKAVIENIVKDIEQRNYSLTSGDIGFHYLLKVLKEAGRNDIIFKMNNRTDVPGYGYQIEHGATALTESWQGLPIVSNNHLMLGHLMQWFYEGLGGISKAANSVGYKNIVIRPQVVGDITHAEADFQSPYGEIRSVWKKTGNNFELNVTIPANSTATIYLPGAGKAFKVGSGNYNYQVRLK
jgi:alpha-L-rhamnosidase